MNRLTAGAIAAAVTAGETTAASVIEAHLDAIETASGLNAFTAVEGERAVARAADIDRRRRAGEPTGRLSGVPVALKDIIDHAGRTTTCGSSFYRHDARRSATIVDRLEAAGAVIIGRAGLHEFAFGFSSENPWFGPVRNPWDPATSPGGSSGGSAVAVAAGLAAISIGTDTGGSVRVPAALCGIVGLKVTHGRVPLTGVFPLAPSLDTVGPLARTVADADLVYRVIAGDDPADPWSAPRPVEAPAGPASLPGLEVGIPHPWVDAAMDTGTRAGFETALERLSASGANVTHVLVPDLDDPDGMRERIYRPEIRDVHREWFEADPDRYGEPVRTRIREVLAADPAELAGALAWRAGLRNGFDRLLGRFDVLVTPAVAGRHKPIGEPMVETEAGPLHYRAVFSRFSALVNIAGHPALVLPLDDAGTPPASLQLIGSRWDEARLLEIGLSLEEAGIIGVRPPPE